MIYKDYVLTCTWAYLPSKSFISELDILLPKDSMELIGTYVQQTELTGCVSRQMEYNKVISERITNI